MASSGILEKQKNSSRNPKGASKLKNEPSDDIEELLMAHVVVHKKTETSDSTEDEVAPKIRRRPGRPPKKKHNAQNISPDSSALKKNPEAEQQFGKTKENSAETSKRLAKVSEKYAAYISSKTKSTTPKRLTNLSPKVHVLSEDFVTTNHEKQTPKTESNSDELVEKPTDSTKDQTVTQKENICQLCGTKGTDLVDLDSAEAEELQLRDKIKKHMPQQLSTFNNSRHICEKCQQTVLNWAQYYERCTQGKTIKKDLNDDDKIKMEKEKKNETAAAIKSETTGSIDPPTISDSESSESSEEDNIEKMLRKMHEVEKQPDINLVKKLQSQINEQSSSPQLVEEEMEMEFLDHEKDLVDQALFHQKGPTIVTSSESFDEFIEEHHDTEKKIIRMDRKLTEDELRSLLNRTGFKSLTTVFLMKFNTKRSFQVGELDKLYKATKDKCNRIKSLYKNKENLNTDYYENIAKTYAHLILENVQTEKEMFFRCPECRIYLASRQFTKHFKQDHDKLVALCDYCRLLLPYESQDQKTLVLEHINLHNANHKYKSPEIITNTKKLIDSVNMSENIISGNKSLEYGSSENNSCKLKYSCSKCSSKFKQEREILEHVKLHKRERVVCDVCSKTFESKFELIEHDEEHKDCDSKLICETCGETYTNLECYEIHLQLHNPKTGLDFICPHCNKNFSRRNDFLTHIKVHKEKSYICTICSDAFSQREQMLEHKKIIHGMNLLFCPHCNFFSPFNSRLKLHMKAQHGNSAFFCEECNDTFVTMKRLREHMVENHSQNFENFECPLCDWKFIQETNVLKHFDVHIEKGHTKCKVCGEQFIAKGPKLEISDVEEHKALHTEVENLVFKRPYSPSVTRMMAWRDNKTLRMFCRDCNETFSTPIELRRHQRCHKPFYCNVCQSVSNNEQTFNHHMLQHEDRKYECSECGKRFVSYNALSLHLRSHSNTLDFQCSVCQRRFKKPIDWKRHEKVCRETHGLPINTPKARRGHRSKNKENPFPIFVKPEEDEEEDPVEFVDSNEKPEYVLVNDPDDEDVYIPKEEVVEFILEDENSDSENTIEIDESELSAFQEWQKVAIQNKASLKRDLTFDTISGKRIRLIPQSNDDLSSPEQMFYSIEQIGEKSPESEFVETPQFVLHGNIKTQLEDDDVDDTDDQEKYVMNDENYIIDSGEMDAESAVYVNADETNVVHVLDNSSNIVYNMSLDGNLNDLNMQTITDENILFQPTEPSNENNDIEMADNNFENISYVFDNAINSDLGKVTTIYLQKETNTNQVVMNDINQSVAIVDKNQIKVVKFNN